MRQFKGNVPEDAAYIAELEPVTCGTCGQDEQWFLARIPDTDSAFQNYKLYAGGPVCQKANYWFSMIDTHFCKSRNAALLYKHRRELFEQVRNYVQNLGGSHAN